MKIAFFDAKEYDREYFDKYNTGHQISYFDENLSTNNCDKAKGFDAVCAFVNTPGDAEILEQLASFKVKYWLQRSMGYNRVDLKKANKLGIKVFRVPNYSAESVGEHALTLLMAVNRQLQNARDRIEKFNFSLNGLQGKAIHGSTVGVIGSGKIGQTFIKPVVALGAKVIVFDEFAQKHFPDTAKKIGFEWVDFDTFLAESDFISIHCPLLPSTTHLINKSTINKMKDGVIIVNCARGPIIDTSAVLKGLKSGKIAGLGLDVIEREEGRFFLDRSSDKNLLDNDPEWQELIASPNVVITAHQAFFTTIALKQIAQITLNNASEAEKGKFEKSLQLQADGKVLNG